MAKDAVRPAECELLAGNGHPHPARRARSRDPGLADGKSQPRSALKISKNPSWTHEVRAAGARYGTGRNATPAGLAEPAPLLTYPR